MKKKTFLLLEVLIALFLAGILLMCLFRFFSELTLCEKKIITARETMLKRHLLEIRLNLIMDQIKAPDVGSLFFYTKDNGLFFFFDNNIDPDPNYSRIIKGKLHVEKNNLILTTYSKKNFREEILFTDVQDLSFEFLEKQNNFKPCIHWNKKSMPDIVKIFIKTNTDTLSLKFFLNIAKRIDNI